MTTLKLEPQQAEGGGGGDVTREYVDQRDAATLDSANGYTDLVASGKQNTLTAGANITIENDVISATNSTTTVAWGEITGELSNQADLSAALANKQDTLTAGANITINANNVISATGLTSVAWGDINGTISNQTDLQNALNAKQDTLTAGTNVQINGTTISATDTTYTAGPNVSISAQNVISSINTTYTDFVGTDGQSDGDNGLVPAPVVADVDKFLKSDGTWATVQSGGSTITMTSSDPGEGQPLAADQYLAHSVAGSTREVKISNTSSIELEAGKWLVFHTLEFHQGTLQQSGVLYYNLGAVDSSAITWAVSPPSGQEVYDAITRFNIVELQSTTTCTRTASNTQNVTITRDKWVAIPID